MTDHHIQRMKDLPSTHLLGTGCLLYTSDAADDN